MLWRHWFSPQQGHFCRMVSYDVLLLKQRLQLGTVGGDVVVDVHCRRHCRWWLKNDWWQRKVHLLTSL